MTSQAHPFVDSPSSIDRDTPFLREIVVRHSGLLVAAAALVAGLIAFWVTIRADFLAYPGWLAVQKLDLIVGPVLVGLYWRRSRPGSRFGTALIGLGFVGVPYILQSSSRSLPFTLGVLWEIVIFLATLAAILAFPNGRWGRRERLILLVAVAALALPEIVGLLLSPAISGGGSISGCKGTCPANALLVASRPDIALDILDVVRYSIIAVDVLTAALLMSHVVRGTPARRRAFAVGTPVALAFLLMQALYQATTAPHVDFLDSVSTEVRWGVAAARSLIWYGFLVALVVAQLYAAGVLRRFVNASLRRPSLGGFEALLRRPLGDPGLRIGHWDPGRRDWIGVDGEPLEVPAGSGRVLTHIQSDGAHAVGIDHDADLTDDPELLQAVGAVALLALEYARFETGWRNSVIELRRSRERIATTNDLERHAIERAIHDGLQQHLLAMRVRLTLTESLASAPALQAAVGELSRYVDDAIAELREIAHEIYPQLLADHGPVEALRSVAVRSGGAIRVTGSVSRHPIEIESALYHSCLEALHLVTQRAGPSSDTTVELGERANELWFVVRNDDGFVGDPDALRSAIDTLHDRVGAFDGHVEIAAAHDRGIRIAGFVLLRTP